MEDRGHATLKHQKTDIDLRYLYPNINVFMPSDECFQSKTANNINFLARMKPDCSLGRVLMMNVHWQLNSGQPTKI